MKKWFHSFLMALILIVPTLITTATLSSCNASVPSEDGNNMIILTVLRNGNRAGFSRYEAGYITSTVSGTVWFSDSTGKFNAGDTVRIVKISK